MGVTSILEIAKDVLQGTSIKVVRVPYGGSYVYRNKPQLDSDSLRRIGYEIDVTITSISYGTDSYDGYDFITLDIYDEEMDDVGAIYLNNIAEVLTFK